MDKIKGKTIWLTGASSGIGSELAKLLAKSGNTVIISARSEDKLDELASQYPENLIVVPADIADFEQKEAIRSKLSQHTDHLDTLIMAAGVAEYEDDLSFNMDMYQKVISVNLLGAINTVGIALPLLKKASQKAHIVGISSLSTRVGFPRAEAYGTSKAGLEYFLQSLTTDLNPRKFDVTTIRPGFVKTPMTDKNDFPMPFMLSAGDAAERIYKGISKRPRIFSFPKRLSLLLWVLSRVPSFWYRYLGPKLSRQ